jgi:ribosomal protein L11 methyltransferase
VSDDWIEVQVETDAAVTEILAAAVSPYSDGVEVRDSTTFFPTSGDRAAVVVLCRPQDEAALMEEIEQSLALARAGGTPVDPVAVRRRVAREEEWRDVWKQFFRATRVGARFVVRPSWDQDLGPLGRVAPEEIVDLDPGRAFGTGAHPSTRLVIALAEELAGRQVQRFLDLGCGSGILAIVAARLWPGARGLALDLDPEAADCSRENLARNRITTVEARPGTLEAAAGTFDLVMANIQADVLIPLAGPLAARLAPGATLLLSGLLAADTGDVGEAYRAAGLELEGRREEGEWAALRLKKG